MVSSLNMSAANAGVSSVASGKSEWAGQAKADSEASAASFSAMRAARAETTSAVVEAPRAAPGNALAADRPFTLGDAILNTMNRMGQSAREHWQHVAAPLNPAVGFSSADLLNRQMHLQRFMLEVEFASLLSKQAAKTVDQISRTQ